MDQAPPNPAATRPDPARGAAGLAWRLGGALLVAGAATAGPAGATSLGAQGVLLHDSDTVGFRLQVAAGEVLDVRSLGWGGGTLSDGRVVAGGGFASVLSLFDADGELLGLDAGSSHSCSDPGAGRPDRVLGFCWDAALHTTLAAGLYTLVLSQDGNLPLGRLDDGFDQQGDYTTAWQGAADGPDARFIDITGTPRDGHWALDIRLTPQAVPEPDPLALLATAALAALLGGRRRHGAARAF